jgi:hypothetical protein
MLRARPRLEASQKEDRPHSLVSGSQATIDSQHQSRSQKRVSICHGHAGSASDLARREHVLNDLGAHDHSGT